MSRSKRLSTCTEPRIEASPTLVESAGARTWRKRQQAQRWRRLFIRERAMLPLMTPKVTAGFWVLIAMQT